MNLMKHILSAILAIAFTQPAFAEKQAPETEGKEVLRRFLGTWDTNITNKGNGETFRTTGKRKWSKQGGVVIFDELDLSTNKEQHFLLTYDPAAKVYRGSFLNHAVVGTYLGTWDEKTATMTWEGSDSFGLRHRGTERFIDKDNVEWSLAFTDSSGKVVLELDAKSTRKKK